MVAPLETLSIINAITCPELSSSILRAYRAFIQRNNQENLKIQ